MDKASRKTSISVRDDDESNEGIAYEWSGVFDTPDRIYVWSAQKVDGEYAETTMKLVVLSAPNATKEALQELDPIGKRLFSQRCRPAQYRLIKAGESITPDADACYMLEFDADAWQTLFKVRGSPPAPPSGSPAPRNSPDPSAHGLLPRHSR